MVAIGWPIEEETILKKKDLRYIGLQHSNGMLWLWLWLWLCYAQLFCRKEKKAKWVNIWFVEERERGIFFFIHRQRPNRTEQEEEGGTSSARFSLPYTSISPPSHTRVLSLSSRKADLYSPPPIFSPSLKGSSLLRLIEEVEIGG
ncbi:hypothetical protein SAY87_012981 [Trapa incisa]|uniref:Uncharacterized protein n=1 Tax=Trapa incisa TaxID=236973 RepID=A0AAN7K7W9_9MYRT|nr:hypothetical protein SAY87_012981 [Trapa incisa]